MTLKLVRRGQACVMRRHLVALAQANGGLVSRTQALGVVRRHVLDDALNDRLLRLVFPKVYVLADVHVDRQLMRRAALVYLPSAAVSHLDGLDVWRLCPALDPTIHLTASREHSAVFSPRITLHRRTGFRTEPPAVVERDGLRVVRLERALIDSWTLLPAAERRGPLITAIRDRRTTAERLTAALDETPRVRGAAEIRRLIAAVAGGCHSELELWGHDHVFSDRRLPPSCRQHAVRVASRTMYLDRYFPVERVAVELDGAAWHGEAAQRERDLRRDAALAAIGILVVRFSHRRLMSDPRAVVEELCAILASRRETAVGM